MYLQQSSHYVDEIIYSKAHLTLGTLFYAQMLNHPTNVSFDLLQVIFIHA